MKRGIAWLSLMLLMGCSAPLGADEGVAGHTHAPSLQSTLTALDGNRPRIVVQSDAGPNPWTSLNLNNDPRHFQFAIVTDRTGGHRPGIFEDAVRKLNLLQPEFVMSVGDLIEGYTTDLQIIDAQWKEFQSFTSKLQMPFFYVPGNHDITNPTMAKEWEKRFGRAYYHFVYQDVLFLCLNSEDGRATTIGDAQLKYFEKALAENPNVRWTLAFLHKPMWVEETKRTPAQGPGNWARFEALLQPRPHTVFAGHYHSYMSHTRNDRKYIVLASTGGSSRLRGPNFGEFDHVAWVTMTPEGPRIANLMLSGIWDENILTPELQARMAPLLRTRIGMPALLTQDDKFRGGTAQLRLVNDADIPMKVQGRFDAHPMLTVLSPPIDFTVPPNSVKLVDVQLRTSQLQPVSQLPPIVLRSTIFYDLPDRPQIEIQSVQKLQVERINTLARRRKAPNIDGNLNEWKLPFVVEQPAQILMNAKNWKGPRDAAFRFGIEADERFVYLAIQATDDNIVTDAKKLPWQQDSVEVRLDARPTALAGQNLPLADLTDVLLIAMSPGAGAMETAVHEKAKLPAGTQAVCVRTREGHNSEIAIPIEYFQSRQNNWRSLRLNIALDDFDNGETGGTQLWWRPDWRGSETFAGSGAFMRR